MERSKDVTADVMAESWLQKVIDEHRELNGLVAELQAFLEAPRPEIREAGYHTWAVSLSDRLMKLHDKLFRHFRHEEEGGMKEELLVKHPRAERRIEKVMGEHPEMLETLRQLMSDALAYSEGRQIAEPRLRRRLSALLEALASHEREETDLIQRLEYRDLGAAD